MDETPRQLIRETRTPIPMGPGQPARHDYEHRRCGTCNVFMATEPLAGKRMTRVTARRTRTDRARFLADIAARYRDATRITLVMDNPDTHRPGSLYGAYPQAQARALWDRFEFVYTPKHGSWLNVAEVELNVMNRQCLNRATTAWMSLPARLPPGRPPGTGPRPGWIGSSLPRMRV